MKVLQIGGRCAQVDGVIPRYALRGHAKDGVDELTLTHRIALSDPADLPFLNCMHRLIALDRSTRTLGRSEAASCQL